MEREAFQPGETVFRAGDPSDRAFLIIIGEVSAQLPDGRTRSLGPGQMFGEMGLFDSMPRSATIVAEKYTVCASYSEAELLDAIRSNPDGAIDFIKALIGRLRDANQAARRDKPHPRPGG
jgi:CRP/FNR family transcriptional regulator, cyclic AMP receptor protein